MVAAVFLIASGLAPFFFSRKRSPALHDYTAEVHPRDGVGGATYECMNTRAYAGVDEICTSEKTQLCLHRRNGDCRQRGRPVPALSVYRNTQQSDLVADEGCLDSGAPPALGFAIGRYGAHQKRRRRYLLCSLHQLRRVRV
jgi:hypothetical protein